LPSLEMSGGRPSSVRSGFFLVEYVTKVFWAILGGLSCKREKASEEVYSFEVNASKIASSECITKSKDQEVLCKIRKGRLIELLNESERKGCVFLLPRGVDFDRSRIALGKKVEEGDTSPGVSEELVFVDVHHLGVLLCGLGMGPGMIAGEGQVGIPQNRQIFTNSSFSQKIGSFVESSVHRRGA